MGSDIGTGIELYMYCMYTVNNDKPILPYHTVLKYICKNTIRPIIFKQHDKKNSTATYCSSIVCRELQKSGVENAYYLYY